MTVDAPTDREPCFLCQMRKAMTRPTSLVCHRCWWALPSPVRHAVHWESPAVFRATIARYRRRRRGNRD